MRDPHLAQAGGYTSTWFAGSGDEGRMGTPFTGGSTTGLFCIEGLLSKVDDWKSYAYKSGAVCPLSDLAQRRPLFISKGANVLEKGTC